MNQYNEDSRDQWEDTLAIHASEWKTRYQMGNTLPPGRQNEYTEWRARYEHGHDVDHPQNTVPIIDKYQNRGTSSDSEMVNEKDRNPDDPPTSVESKGTTFGKAAALGAGGFVLVGGIGWLGKWLWDKFSADKRRKRHGSDHDGEDDDTLAGERSGQAKRPSQKVENRRVKRNHARQWVPSIDYETTVM
jgi:hypothetical protein